MEKPRQGVGKIIWEEPLSTSSIAIENNPGLRSVTRVVFEWSFTAIMWALWVYLFLPMISLVMWAVGLHLFYVHLFEGAALERLADLLGQMGLTVLIVFVILRGWGYYNLYKFGRRDRRRRRPVATRDLLGRQFNLSSAQVLSLQSQKEIVWTGLYAKPAAGKRPRRRFEWENCHEEAA